MMFFLRIWYALQIAFKLEEQQLFRALQAMKSGCSGCRRKPKQEHKRGCGGCRDKQEHKGQKPNNKKPVSVPRLPTEVVKNNFTRLHEVT